MGTTEEREITLLTDLQYLQSCIAARQTLRRIGKVLDCNTDQVEDVVKEMSSNGEGFVTRDEIKTIFSWIETAQQYIGDAQYSAEDASSKACQAEEECSSANGYLDDIMDKVSGWKTKVEDLEKKEELLARHPETIKALATGTDEIHEAEEEEKAAESNG